VVKGIPGKKTLGPKNGNGEGGEEAGVHSNRRVSSSGRMKTTLAQANVTSSGVTFRGSEWEIKRLMIKAKAGLKLSSALCGRITFPMSRGGAVKLLS